MWSAQQNAGPTAPVDLMMPPPSNLVGTSPHGTNPHMGRRSSSSLQLILPDNLKTEVLDENSQNSLMGDNSLPGMPNVNSVASPLDQLVSESSRDSTQSGMIRSAVPANGSPVQDALLGVVDLMRNPLSIVPQQSPFSGLHESSQVR